MQSGVLVLTSKPREKATHSKGGTSATETPILIIRNPPFIPPICLSRPHNLSRLQHQRRLLHRRGVDSCVQHLGLQDRGFVAVRLGTFAGMG